MALNSISPTTFTSGVLITDTTKVTNGSPDAIVNKITPGVALDVQSTLGGFCVPRMTNTQIAALPMNNGMIAYDTTNGNFVNWAQGAIIPMFPIPILTDGTNNLFMGFSTGSVNALATSIDTVLVGMDCGSSVTTGSGLTGLGLGCGDSITTASNCTFIGFAALNTLITGDNTTAVGAGAGASRDNLTSCTFLGRSANTNANGRTNSMALGFNAIVSVDNACVIGDGTVNLGVGTSSPIARVHAVNAAGLALKTTGGIVTKYTLNSASTYTALISDYVIGNATDVHAVTLTLPAITATNTGQVYVIKDVSGNADNNNITVETADAAKIDGNNNKLVASAWGAIVVVNNGTDWFTIQ